MNKNKFWILITAIIGLGLSAELCKIYYDANFNPYALDSFCTVNDVIDCDGVAKTEFSQSFGVPLCIWGVLFYSFIIFLTFAQQLSQIKIFKFAEVFKNPKAYIFCLSVLAFLISIILACISIFEIEKICALCFTTYFTDLILAIISKEYSQPFLYEIKQSFADFKDAINIKKYLIAFIIVLVIFAGILTYTTKSQILTPQLKKTEYTFDKDKKYPSKDNTMGDKNSAIVIHEFIDYNCASCYLTNLSTKRIMSEYTGIYLIQHNLPLDSECNPIVTKGHEGSCTMARYALAAKKQGKYWEANEILFEKTPKTEKEIIKILSKINGINKNQLKEDASSEEIKNELSKDIEYALQQKIDATPTMIINLQKITGNIPYNDLKEKLINSGAKEKSTK